MGDGACTAISLLHVTASQMQTGAWRRRAATLACMAYGAAKALEADEKFSVQMHALGCKV